MTRLTLSEAEDMIDHMSGMGELVNPVTYEATVFDCDVSEARLMADMFASGLGREIDPTSIEITPDRLDDMDIPCVTVTVRLGAK